MTPPKKTRLGIVTTGHGPRDEYIRYHERLLAHLGAPVEVVIRHALDGLSYEQLKPHIVGPGVLNLGAHVHVPGATGNRLGPGWQHLFFDLRHCVARIQAAIDALETEDGVDLVLLACAAEFPEGALRARGVCVHPRELLFALAEAQAWDPSRRPRIGVLVDHEHLATDQADWQRRPWGDRVDLHFAPIHDDILAAAATLGGRVDMCFMWGYGVGLVAGDPPGLVTRLEEAIGAPLILPHRVATLFVRNLIRPPLDDLAFSL
jgi:hypothetical protein